MNNLVAKDLYKDVYVASMHDYLNSKNAVLTQRLRMYHPRFASPPDYHSLLEPLYDNDVYYWGLLGSGRYPGDDMVDAKDIEDSDAVVVHIRQTDEAGLRIRRSLESSTAHEVFPDLRQVVLGDADKLAFCENTAYLRDITTGRLAPLPMALIDIPSVEHVCQSMSFGPFALPGKEFVKPKHAIKTFTYHFRPHQTNKPATDPPLVIGAVNRYIFKGGITVKTWLKRTEPDRILGGIYMLILKKHILQIHGDESREYRPLSQSDIDSTTIEIYDFVRSYDAAPPSENEEARRSHVYDGGREMGDVATIQRWIDGMIGGFKGRIVYKDREDCPVCPACGYDWLAEQRESMIRVAVDAQ